MNNGVFVQKPKEGEPWDTAIIGSGPASLTAAIYTTRGAASTVVFTGDKWGGQLMLTTAVDNYPGFPDGIQGPELINLMRRQAERFGTEFIERSVTSVDFSAKPFKLFVDDKLYLANSVIIATGAETRWLGIPGEQKLIGRGVSSCAPCDAPFYKDKAVTVVGGGDSAMEEALTLTKYALSVTIIHRRDSFRASQAMQQKVQTNPKISTIWDTELIEVIGDQMVHSIKLKTKLDSKTAADLKSFETGKYQATIHEEKEGFLYWQMPIQGIFVAVGHVPSTLIFKDKLDLDEKGYLKVSNVDPEYRMMTSVPGVFTAGDVHDHHYRQAVTAAGFGCMAALEVLKYLDKPTPSW